MSKFMRLRSEVLKDIDKDIFYKAIEEMGFEADESKKVVGNAYGSDNVDGTFISKGKDLSLGYIFKDEKDGSTSLEIRGDFWNTGYNQEEFVNKISQFYQKNRIEKELLESGFNIYDNFVNKENDLVLKASILG